MTKPFFETLRNHLSDIGKALKNNADAASIFPNTGDIGLSREKTYADFLVTHCPANCKVSFGGFIFDQEGNRSQQIDVIITNSKTLQFNWLNRGGNGKIFACIDGCVAVASIKSNLTREELNNALANIASLPSMQPLTVDRIPPGVKIMGYDDWPYKIIYATTGATIKTTKAALNDYYNQNPYHKKPHIIHVIGEYVIIRRSKKHAPTKASEKLHLGHDFYYFPDKNNMVGLAQIIKDVQNFAQGSEGVIYYYNKLFDNLMAQGVFEGKAAIPLDEV
jgi:hypothetical protein